MKKPDRVEVGQWWRLTYSEMREPVRVESTDIYGTMPVGVFDGWWSSASLIMSKGEYLGSGDHPEPSGWMIETLAEHAWDSRGDDMHWSEIGTAFQDKMRADVRRLIAGSDCDPFEWNATVLSLYRILRSLGKW